MSAIWILLLRIFFEFIFELWQSFSFECHLPNITLIGYSCFWRRNWQSCNLLYVHGKGLCLWACWVLYKLCVQRPLIFKDPTTKVRSHMIHFFGPRLVTFFFFPFFLFSFLFIYVFCVCVFVSFNRAVWLNLEPRAVQTQSRAKLASTSKDFSNH